MTISVSMPKSVTYYDGNHTSGHNGTINYMPYGSLFDISKAKNDIQLILNYKSSIEQLNEDDTNSLIQIAYGYFKINNISSSLLLESETDKSPVQIDWENLEYIEVKSPVKIDWDNLEYIREQAHELSDLIKELLEHQCQLQDKINVSENIPTLPLFSWTDLLILPLLAKGVSKLFNLMLYR